MDALWNRNLSRVSTFAAVDVRWPKQSAEDPDKEKPGSRLRVPRSGKTMTPELEAAPDGQQPG